MVMSAGSSKARLRALVRLACGRIAGGARAILEAHDLGVSEGRHERPWTAGYHEDAVRVYAASLPASYQSRIGELFRCSADIMAEETVPGHLAEDWMIVRQYMTSASSAIAAHHAALRHEAQQPDVPPFRELAGGGSPPMVIRFDLLAGLTASEGARQLERAAVVVRDHMEAPLPALDDSERHMLMRLKAGLAIVDLAAEMGYSERSMYRALARLWDRLGVPGRKEGIHRAGEMGLFD